jgi:dienelactone hydrolase
MERHTGSSTATGIIRVAEPDMLCSKLWAAGLGLLLLAAGTAPAGAQPYKIKHLTKEFDSGGKKVRVEQFQPDGDRKWPAIILAPESGSFKVVGPVYRAIATRLAEDGYVLLIVHFFDRTGHDGVDPKQIQEKDFLEWMAALEDGVKYTRGLPQVDKDRVGLLGFSLGAYLAVSVAADETIPVKALASYFGGVPGKLWPRLKKLPPTLIVHGTQDKLVSVAEAYALAGFCEHKGLTHECKIFDKEGHLFEKTLKDYVAVKLALWLAQGKFKALPPAPEIITQAIAEAIRQDQTVREAVQTGLAFFKKHLK